MYVSVDDLLISEISPDHPQKHTFCRAPSDSLFWNKQRTSSRNEIALKKNESDWVVELKATGQGWAMADPTDPYKARLLKQALELNSKEGWIELALEMERSP